MHLGPEGELHVETHAHIRMLFRIMGLDEMMEGEEKKREPRTELQGTLAFRDGW